MAAAVDFCMYHILYLLGGRCCLLFIWRFLAFSLGQSRTVHLYIPFRGLSRGASSTVS